MPFTAHFKPCLPALWLMLGLASVPAQASLGAPVSTVSVEAAAAQPAGPTTGPLLPQAMQTALLRAAPAPAPATFASTLSLEPLPVGLLGMGLLGVAVVRRRAKPRG